jgi:hypothetical protein
VKVGTATMLDPPEPPDDDPLEENRRMSLRALLPRLQKNLLVSLIEAQFDIAAGGFLEEFEMNTIFDPSTNKREWEKVRDVVKSLLTKSNGAYKAFCRILDENGYEHWSKVLNTEVKKKNVASLFIKEKSLHIHDVEVLEKSIGSGDFSEVREATWHGKSCAVKLFKNITEGDMKKSVTREVSEWALWLKHPNIVQFYGLKDVGSSIPGIVMERLHVSLDGFLTTHKENIHGVPLKVKRSILLDVCCAMQYLHSQYVIHRDLKAANILLTRSFIAKISDFGTARICDKDGQFSKIEAKEYTAPEVSTGEYGLSSDVFSYGCVILHVMIHEFPLRKPVQEMHITEYQRREHLVKSVDPMKYDEFPLLVEKCLNDDPKNRPVFAEIQKKLQTNMSFTDEDCFKIQVEKFESQSSLMAQVSMPPVRVAHEESPHPTPESRLSNDRVIFRCKLPEAVVRESTLQWSIGIIIAIIFAIICFVIT